jgi:hypothetical protein
MKHTIFFTVIFCIVGGVASSQSSLKFDSYEHDFEEIKEVKGVAHHTFEFTNTSNEPVGILGVDVECGCTTPEWSEKTIKPGERGFVKAGFNPEDVQGAFHKLLTVRATTDTVELLIKGAVIPKPLPLAVRDKELLIKKGCLRVKSSSFQFGTITNEKAISKTFYLYNRCDEELNMRYPDSLPVYFTYKASKAIKANSLDSIVISYDVPQRGAYGYLIDSFPIYTSEDTLAKKDMEIRASVVEYFPPMKASELEKAPKAIVKEERHDFGQIRKGAVYTHQFTLKNEGKTPLLIRGLQPTCDCISAKVESMTVQAGDSVQIKTTLDTKPLSEGNQAKSIILITNDPQNSMQYLRLKAKLD